VLLVERIPEPELMDSPAQAAAYAAADFSEPHDAFVAAFAERFPELHDGRVIDLGCGTADVTVRFAAAFPDTTLVGFDGAPAMLDLAVAHVQSTGTEARVELRLAHLPDHAVAAAGPFDALISNSLLHHLTDPAVLWDTVVAVLRPGAPVFVMDLRRPESTEAASALVDRYAADEDPLLRADFEASLCAAYRVDEIAGQLAVAGLALDVEPLGDRHVLVWGRASGR
jgi:ubiquinone/menaquinone biosynthesis C-methylase UbiE